VCCACCQRPVELTTRSTPAGTTPNWTGQPQPSWRRDRLPVLPHARVLTEWTLSSSTGVSTCEHQLGVSAGPLWRLHTTAASLTSPAGQCHARPSRRSSGHCSCTSCEQLSSRSQALRLSGSQALIRMEPPSSSVTNGLYTASVGLSSTVQRDSTVTSSVSSEHRRQAMSTQHQAMEQPLLLHDQRGLPIGPAVLMLERGNAWRADFGDLSSHPAAAQPDGPCDRRSVAPLRE
jgi:hypothetical protein